MQLSRGCITRYQAALAGDVNASTVFIYQLRYELRENAVCQLQIRSGRYVIDPAASGVLSPCLLLAQLRKPIHVFIRVLLVRFGIVDDAKTMWPSL